MKAAFSGALGPKIKAHAKMWAAETPNIKNLPNHVSMKKPRLGNGKRFASLKAAVAKKGIKNPAALAASIGIKKYGKAKMAKMAAAGRKKA